MRQLSLAGALALLLLAKSTVSAMPLLHRRARELRAKAAALKGVGSQDNVQKLVQPLDHFDRLNPSTWQQRYFVNDTFFDGSGPVFLCVGGESNPMDDEIVVSGEAHCGNMIVAAQEHGALIAALEHRYYNPPADYPVEDLSTENLRFLSSQQALADLANFHTHLSQQYKLCPVSNRWVTWGGSYPGMMAGWARYKYPHLIWAAVSSSAPVQAVANMQGYNDVSAAAIASEDIGGSQACQDAVRSAFAAVGEALAAAEDRETLYSQFGVCDADSDPLADELNATEFTMDLSYLAYSQSNDPADPTPINNVGVTCSAYFLNESLGEPIERLAALNAYSQGGECLGVSYQANEVESMQDVSLTGASDTDVFCNRCWLFQTCTQFGFYQTCDPDSDCVFTSAPHLNTLDKQLDLCTSSFDIDADVVQDHIDFSNAYYGGDRPDSARIMYVNGAADPWHAQGINQDAGRDLPALYVAGASHHFWTHPELESDQQSVKDARVIIRKQVAEWLAMPTPPPPSAEL